MKQEIDPRLPRELVQQSALGGHMGGNAHRVPVFRACQQFNGILAACRRRLFGIVNPAFPDESLKDVVLIRVEETQEMNAVFRDRFKTAERIESDPARRAHKAGGVLDAVGVRDCDDLNVGFKAGFDDRPVVVIFRRESGRLVVPGEIGERIDLQGAAIEPRTVRKIHRGLPDRALF